MSKFVKASGLLGILAITGCATTAPQDTALSSGSVLAPVNTASGTGAAIGTTSAIAGNAISANTPGASQMPALAGMLVQQLGISPLQAMGGAGSIFSVAQRLMNPTSFGLVSNAVPGMSDLLAAAPALGGSLPGAGGLLGNAASALGSGSNLGQLALLANSFQSLGLSGNMVNQFIPIILQYVQSQGGASTMGLLQSALMP